MNTKGGIPAIINGYRVKHLKMVDLIFKYVSKAFIKSYAATILLLWAIFFRKAWLEELIKMSAEEHKFLEIALNLTRKSFILCDYEESAKSAKFVLKLVSAVGAEIFHKNSKILGELMENSLWKPEDSQTESIQLSNTRRGWLRI